MEDLRLKQELLGLLKEELLGHLVTEAIGLAIIDGVDGAIRADVLAESEAHHAFVAELAFGGTGGAQACAKREGAGKSAQKRSLRHGSLLAPDLLVGAVGLEPTTR